MSSTTVRRQRLDSIILKRMAAVEYFRNFFNGDSFWMNCVYFSKIDVRKFITSHHYKIKCTSYFLLGISLSKLNDGLKQHDSKYLYAIIQLFEEWEYYHSSSHIQAMKYLMAKTSITVFPTSDFSHTDPDKFGIYKSQNEVVYEFLLTPHLPFELSFIEVFMNLCDELAELYEYLKAPEYALNKFHYQAILKADSLIQTHIFASIATDIEEEANVNLKHDIDALRIGAGALA